jgi:phosphoribosylamine--glycine ligase
MKVLIIGGGGREHALAWKIARSAQVKKVFVAPGNAGTAKNLKTENIAINAEDIDALKDFAIGSGIDFTLVGPEAPLVSGIVDEFNSAGLPIFGPQRAAAQLEGSKTFAKDFLVRHGIPTASHAAFTTIEEASSYIHRVGAPLVVKADGLAAGKGVILAQSEQEAIAAVELMLKKNAFGEAGHRIVIEDYLQGEEASFICMVDGEHILPLATSQDHKPRDNGDLGPNTGGMGAYSPAPIISSHLHERIMAEIIEPTVRGIAADGIPYTGFLYAGLMIGADDTPRVLEFNCRMGDPETQPIMLRLKSDLVELCQAALNGALASVTAQWDDRAALGVVLAAGGYPAAYRKGDIIEGQLDMDATDLKVFHAGTALKGNRVVTNGGRVLCVTASGETVREAQQNAYAGVKKIHWDGVYYRTDIGYKAVSRESTTGV